MNGRGAGEITSTPNPLLNNWERNIEKEVIRLATKGYFKGLNSLLCRLKKLNVLTKMNYLAAFLSGWIILGLIFYNVYATCARYIFNSPPPGSTEISTYLIPVLAFLALAYTLEVRRHIIVDTFITRLKMRNQFILNAATTILIAIFGAILAWKGVELNIEKFYERSSSELMLPLFIFYIFVPIGGLLLFLQSIRNIKTYVLSLKRKNFDKDNNKLM